MFRSLGKAILGIGVGSLIIERSCKIGSYKNPKLFRFVVFGKSNEYCQKMITADYENFNYAKYSDNLACKITRKCYDDPNLFRAIISNKKYLWWFVSHKHEGVFVYDDFYYDCMCDKKHKISFDDFYYPVIMNLVEVSKETREKDPLFWKDMDDELKIIIEKCMDEVKSWDELDKIWF